MADDVEVMKIVILVAYAAMEEATNQAYHVKSERPERHVNS